MLSAGVAALVPTLAFANPTRPYWNPGDPYSPVTQPASGETLEISHLFWIMLILAAVIFALVVGGVVISIVRFSAKPGDTEEPPQVFGNRRIELTWTLIPTLILAGAFIATVKAMSDINNPHTTKALFDINAVGHQWWWEFQYPKYNFDTANEVHIPAGTVVHFHVKSYDVIHSFWVPQLQRQIDANPGSDNAVYLKADTVGVYSGECYEYCGEGHAWMKLREVVQSPAQFNAWVKDQQRKRITPTGEAAFGETVFLRNTCVNCHSINGTTAGGAVGPNLTHLASRWGFGAGAGNITVNDLMQWIYDPNTYKPGVIMPGYPFLSHKELHALAVYLVSLK